MTPRERAARERARALFTIAPNDDGYTTVMLGEEVVDVARHVDALVETLRLAAPIAAAIESALAEQAAGEAERVREAVAREREACAQQIAGFFSDDAHKGHILAQYLRARATSPAPEPVAAERAERCSVCGRPTTVGEEFGGPCVYASDAACAERAVVEAAVAWRARLSAKRATGSVLCPPGKSCGAALEAAVDALAAARQDGAR